jgi:hypothetical protein
MIFDRAGMGERACPSFEQRTNEALVSVRNGATDSEENALSLLCGLSQATARNES